MSTVQAYKDFLNHIYKNDLNRFFSDTYSFCETDNFKGIYQLRVFFKINNNSVDMLDNFLHGENQEIVEGIKYSLKQLILDHFRSACKEEADYSWENRENDEAMLYFRMSMYPERFAWEAENIEKANRHKRFDELMTCENEGFWIIFEVANYDNFKEINYKGDKKLIEKIGDGNCENVFSVRIGNSLNNMENVKSVPCTMSELQNPERFVEKIFSVPKKVKKDNQKKIRPK